MRTSMLLATIAAVGGVSAGCAQGSRTATYRSVPDAACAVPSAPRYAPPLSPAPVQRSGGTVVLSSRPAPARIVPMPSPSAPAPVFARAPSPAAAAPAPVFQPVAAAPAPVLAGSPALPGTSSSRSVNATCPVMLGNPVDPAVTAVYQGRVIAFSDYTARWKWNTDPDRYAVNLPRMASGSSSDTIPVFATRDAGRGMTTPSPIAAPTAAPLPQDPTLPSFDALPPVRSMPSMPPASMPSSAAAVTSPRAMPPLPLPAAAPVVRTPVVRAPAPPPAPVAPAAPSLEDMEHGEDEECPGGNCRLPGR